MSSRRCDHVCGERFCCDQVSNSLMESREQRQEQVVRRFVGTRWSAEIKDLEMSSSSETHKQMATERNWLSGGDLLLLMI